MTKWGSDFKIRQCTEKSLIQFDQVLRCGYDRIAFATPAQEP